MGAIECAIGCFALGIMTISGDDRIKTCLPVGKNGTFFEHMHLFRILQGDLTKNCACVFSRMNLNFIKDEFYVLHKVVYLKTSSLLKVFATFQMVVAFRTLTIFLTSQLVVSVRGLKCACLGHLRECKGWQPGHGYFCETNAACFAAVFRIDDDEEDSSFGLILIQILECQK